MVVLRLLFSPIFWLMIVASCYLIGRYLGHMHWLLELFSHFTLHYGYVALFLVGFSLVFGRFLPAALSAALLALIVMQVYPFFVVTKMQDELTSFAGTNITVLQYNVRYTDRDIYEKSQWLYSQAGNADIMVLFEVTEEWAETVQTLSKKYSTHVFHPVRGYRGVAIFSRLPNTQFRVRRINASNQYYIELRARDPRAGKDILLFATHPPPPISTEMARERNRILLEIAYALDVEPADYKILVGDLNVTRWSPVFQDITEITGLRDSFAGQGIPESWPAWLPGLARIAIDHLLVSKHVMVFDKRTGPPFDSDHLPVITELRLP